MYVNYYDRYEKLEDENPTIGILLCKENNDALVEITLPRDTNIYASEYKLYLPDKKLLQDKLQQWIEEVMQNRVVKYLQVYHERNGRFVMYENKKELLSKLEFGSVDSESEIDLDRKFIKTKDLE